MCSSTELKFLLHELLRRVDQVALLSARAQFNEECDSKKYLTSSYQAVSNAITPAATANKRFGEILRFQKAYLRYFVFSNDPCTEIVVPLSISSLSLFITSVISRIPNRFPVSPAQTSRTIVTFLQVCYSCNSIFIFSFTVFVYQMLFFNFDSS